MRRLLASLLILLFLESLIALPSGIVKVESKTIVVPEDYSTISSVPSKMLLMVIRFL